MGIRLFSAMALALALCSVAGVQAQEVGPASPLVGTWEGRVTEGQMAYTVVLMLEETASGRLVGTTTYTGSISCTGTLNFVRQRAGLYEFVEDVRQGRGCAETGRVELWLDDTGTLQYAWYARPHPPEAVTSARRL